MRPEQHCPRFSGTISRAIGFAFDPEFKNIEEVEEGRHEKRAA